jgi:uncharacterized phage protein gp47/JayE
MTSPLNVAIPSIDELQRNAARLLQQGLQYATQAAGAADLSTTDLELARSNLKVLAFVQAVGLHGAYRYLRDFIARQAVPVFASGAFLDGWLQTYGLTRKPASVAAGSIAGTGVAGKLVPAGAIFQTGAGDQVRVTADTVVRVGGTFTASAQALVARSYAVPSGTAFALQSALDGVNSAASAPADWVPGTDVETDEQAIYRLQQRLANEPMGGCPADYARWALSVSGITRAWGIRNPSGPTSAGVIVMADGNPSTVSANGLPTAAQLLAVYSYITDPMRGPPDELHVLAPIPVLIAPQIRLTPDTPAIRAGVTAALKDLFFREAAPGGSIPDGHMIEAVASVVGEYNHTWVAPTLTQGSLHTVPTFQHMLVLADPVFVA